MNWISTQFARHWRNIHFGAIVVLSLALIFWPQQAEQVVGRAVIGGLYYPFFKIRSGAELLASQAEQNRELRASLQDASLRLSMYEEVLLENGRLRSALGFEPPTGYRLMPAEVVSVSGYRLPLAAIINRGANDSVYLNQPIINQQGLIGRVASIVPRFATVQLLTDPANRVAGRVKDSREMGIVRHSTGGGMILDNFPTNGSIAAGDTIVSSGLGGVYPPGLRVAVVTSVEREEHEPFARVKLDPVANFHSVEELFLLRPDDR